ncbi:hypothetical protein JIG36_32760 [Actinoplanes sp. LDG1-06]|uniref:Uncharacterized protein n=1 Tax=Paractinoplanes ovalisporus TaxID=2810368 RepID=A0ABS2AKG3_9ACTN|nr:hypothetical protein [Actinoplanes ovalisporus]MBM2620296.1 hypothetical protein [Actinoplanes ovalisporus]
MNEFRPPSAPPPWIVSETPPARPASRGHRWPIVAVIASAVVAAGAGAGAVAWAQQTETPPAIASAPALPAQQDPVPGPTTDEPYPEPEPEAAALAELERISAQDLTATQMTGQYVAQLASKTPGIKDPLQLAADGTHTFRATDILLEHQRLRADPQFDDAQIVLLKSTTFGKRQLYRGQPLYITFAIAGFDEKNDVLGWCSNHFPGYSGDSLLNLCTARRLQP